MLNSGKKLSYILQINQNKIIKIISMQKINNKSIFNKILSSKMIFLQKIIIKNIKHNNDNKNDIFQNNNKFQINDNI